YVDFRYLLYIHMLSTAIQPLSLHDALPILINAGSQRAAQAALRSMQGEFSARVNAARAALTGLRVYVEAAIDFPEEEIDFLGSQDRKSTRLNSSHVKSSYAVFCLKKKKSKK